MLMSGSVILLMYLLPVLGLILGCVPAWLVWHFHKPGYRR